MALTQPQIDILAGFRFFFPDDVARVEGAIASLQAEIDLWTAIDGAYAASQAIFLARQDTDLEAKAAALAVATPDPDGVQGPNDYEVVYGGTHPVNAGIVPSDWLIRYLTTAQLWSTGGSFVSANNPGAVTSLDELTTYVEGVDYTAAPDTPVPGTTTLTAIALPATVLVHLGIPIPVTVYSHSVNWDENQDLIDHETGWLDYYDLRFDATWGSTFRISRLGLGLTPLERWRELLDEREEGAVLLANIPKYADWDVALDDSLVTIRAASSLTVKTTDGETTFQQGTDYSVVLTGDGKTVLGRLDPDPMSAVVRVSTP